LAGNLKKTLLSLYGTEWRERGRKSDTPNSTSRGPKMVLVLFCPISQAKETDVKTTGVWPRIALILTVPSGSPIETFIISGIWNVG